MKRREFVKTGAATAGMAAGGLLATPVKSENPRVLTIVGPTPDSKWPSGQTKAGNAVRLFEWIEQATDGELVLQFYDKMDEIPEDGEYQYVIEGLVDGYFESEYHLHNFHPAFRAFGALPMGMAEEEHVAWLYHGDGQQLWEELSAQFGLVPILSANIGMQAIGWFTEEIHSGEDLDGRVMHMPGFAGQVMRSYGAITQDFPNSALLDGLRDGRLLGVEKSAPWVDLHYRFYEAAKYYYMTIFHEPQNAVVLGFNRDTWNSIPSRTRDIVRQVCMAHYTYSSAESRTRNAMALRAFRDEHGVQFRQFPEGMQKHFVELSVQNQQEIRERDDIGRRVMDSYQAFEKDAREWTSASIVNYSAMRSFRG